MTPDGWFQTTLEQVADVAIGRTPARSVKSNWDPGKATQNRWATIADIKSKFIGETTEYISDVGVKHSNARLVPKGTLLMSFKLSLGRAAITSTPMYTNEAIAAFYPKRLANTEYLYYLLPSLALEEASDRAVKGRTLNKAKLRVLQLMLPPVAEQRKIAAILSSVDVAIEKTQAVIDQVQVVKRGLMQELLTRGLPGWHTRFRQTEIGEIPEPWEVQPAAAVCERIVVGIVIKPSQYYTDSGVPCLRSLNVKEDRISGREMNYISHASNEELQKSRVSAGDVVTVRTGYPGTSAVVPERLSGANCVDLIISTPGSRIRGDFLSRFLNSERGRAAVEERKGGLAQQHFNVGAMKAMLVPVPSLREQERICDALNAVDRRIRTDTDVLHSLVSLKSAAMSVLLTGDLRVTPAPELV